MTTLTLSPRVLRSVTEAVYRFTGITMDDSKQTMLVSRLSRRLRALELDSFEAYLSLLARDPTEQEQFVDAITTNKTSLFRTASVWNYLNNEWLPERVESGSRSLSAWSAASSSGQEAASLALSLNHQASLKPGVQWRVQASDVSPAMVTLAEAQEFDTSAIKTAQLAQSDLRIASEFSKVSDTRSQLSGRLRKNMAFRRHNIFERFNQGPFDCVLLRNVIIYFNAVDKERAIQSALSRLRPDGLFIIGEAESLSHDHPDLELVEHCIYRRRQNT